MKYTTAAMLAALMGFGLIAHADTPETAAEPAPAAFDIESLDWQTNTEDPPIGDPAAKKGGTFVDYIMAFPSTFRLYGPDSNEAFANWNRAFASDIPLVARHPTTDNYIPMLATHWAIADDNKTVFYRLDERARWSDGRPITADDYVFAREFLSSPHIVDPFANKYIEDYIASVEAIDNHTIKIVGTQESWRPLEDFSLPPIPRHATPLQAGWPQAVNYTPPVVQGPYTISEWTFGERLSFTRNPNWWGYEHQYFQGMFNVDKIDLIVLTNQDTALEYFRLGRLSTFPVYSARQWAQQTDFEQISNGWIIKKQVYLEQPEGMSGIAMNLQVPLFQNRNFRRALQHLFNFEELNSRLMFNAYFRKASVFEGTMFANPDLKPYGFDPREAGRLLREAGFARRGSDGILRDGNDRPARFTLIYGSPSFTPHMEVIQAGFRRAGIDMQLQLLESGTFFQRLREKAFEAGPISMTGGYYPAPHQYFATEFKNRPQTNNFWNFGNEEADRLIDVYRFSMIEEERITALQQLDAMIHDEAFHINFWSAPYIRLLHWRYVKYPDFYFPRRAQSPTDYQVFWIDQKERQRVETAVRERRSLGQDTNVELDPYGVKARLTGAGSN